ncbi:hypothetical protein Micbo1qcDRAFT_161878 [Microdochium bolleyi]|uniref:DUF7053 domain-containing protein n=1 Tax=Microdochium bolleyi TaxID=196109 RepID=A0A136J3U6_9PEZI|nr:hypothetical protein Micbo1qcDRAFT_161878 [Microdochium bolleyi]
MLRKKEVYTVITPIPGFIPRQLALDILHSHKEVITLNPLVLDVKQIEAPRNAEPDEYFSTWYEITERIQVVPGMGRLGGGKIKFNGCFHDMPWGVQSHIYAPMSIDMRNKYRIGGNQPGIEPPEHQEMGLASLGAPKDGLYLREDIEFKCNITLVGVVKAQMKAASKDMIARMMKKAELLDAGVLKAMIEDGKIKTLSANESANVQAAQGLARQHTGSVSLHSQSHSPQLSPANPNQPPMSPGLQYQVPRPSSMMPPPRNDGSGLPGYPAHWQQQQQQHQHQQQQYQQHYQQHQPHYNQYGQPADPTKSNHFVSELAAPMAPPQPSPKGFAFEMPGDYYYQQQAPQSPHTQSSQGHPSPSLNSSRPTSYSHSDGNGFNSPKPDGKGFSSELATHREGPDDYNRPQQRQTYDPSKYGAVSQ